MKLLLELLRDKQEFRAYTDTAVALTLGRDRKYRGAGLKDDLDQIAKYSPNIVEISCYLVNVRLGDFRMLSSITFIAAHADLTCPPQEA